MSKAGLWSKQQIFDRIKAAQRIIRTMTSYSFSLKSR
jgi:hypothetical protein